MRIDRAAKPASNRGELSYRPVHKVRFVTAASLFDGHDASINIIRRLLQDRGVEVVHLGHNRSVREIVDAAIQEDAQAVAVSSYQGGHNEFFRYLVDLLRERDAAHIRVFGGGGGVIVPREIQELERYGVTKIYSPEDGRRLGLSGIIDDMVRAADFPLEPVSLDGDRSDFGPEAVGKLARLITRVEAGPPGSPELEAVLVGGDATSHASVVGITGTGGAGKSSLTDELVRRFHSHAPELPIAVLSIDPTKRRTGGALLGDRIRMNALEEGIYMRSLATRGSGTELSRATSDAIRVLKAAGYRLLFVETSGIGQGSSAISDVSDVSLYVMTPEYGAPSQLEKIDMLDFADVVAINKFDRRGGEDALRDVRKQYRRNKEIGYEVPDEKLPVFGTVASQFGNPGVSALYRHLLERLRSVDASFPASAPRLEAEPGEPPRIIPENRVRYLAEIAETLRDESKMIREQSALARRLYRLRGAEKELAGTDAAEIVRKRFAELRAELSDDNWSLIDEWPELVRRYREKDFRFQVRDREIAVPTSVTTLSGTEVSKVALPRLTDWGDILAFRLEENVPGQYPYTSGVFLFKSSEEPPRRQFAGEGGPRRTNARFHLLSGNDDAKRLSTAFDSVTLYGEDPDERPDIYGKIGEGGVSIATLDDMKELYAGFDLLDPRTSVSMTINGPAPAILAMFFSAAIDQQVQRFESRNGRRPDVEERARIRDETLSHVRGTVQADILKEDQAQNTCIFSTDFALRMMGDVQQYFIDKGIRNFYSVSISGYHIAEAGANPITQLAFTLANGFTYVEYYRARGMQVDDFAPNLSFFFSNGLEPEYSVLGRVARRIWARVMKLRYGANERSQKFKYHIQTSGRSLHAREVQFNDIRTTLQALTAVYDNCNSLHTNAYDEAITTPTAESVRRAMAIQQILHKEFGMAKNENPLQGAYIVSELTDLVEEAVLLEFERINARGGVLGAMELQYQRSRIQEESLHYELKKDSGEYPIVGVNCFLDPDEAERTGEEIELARATSAEKDAQIARLRAFQKSHESDARQALQRLARVARSDGGNVFAELMEAARVASLGQMTHALYEVGGQYRRAL
ncbi:MAG TPA: fused isobutyryl-CoA mutase/GTPase IcmF [Vicinamibacteria bacterium]|nr:fused isobutyryl-CoA mutase/GTPase IcmF [Vicinamibacteria bacterium]